MESLEAPISSTAHYHQLAVSISSVFTQIIINFCICLYSYQRMVFQLTIESGKETDFSISGLVVSTGRHQGAHEVSVCGCMCTCTHLDGWVSGCRKENGRWERSREDHLFLVAHFNSSPTSSGLSVLS